ncbi:MAG: hypothetical protein P3X22_007215 [Thermoprotei archaeon]|nr:hypothetical protein [Thermoprotei archaeon]
MARVRISNVEVEEGGLYTASIQVSYKDKLSEIKVRKLLRKPVRAKAKVEGDILFISIEDSEGKPLSTCCIHTGHLERGCVDCKSLITPP